MSDENEEKKYNPEEEFIKLQAHRKVVHTGRRINSFRIIMRVLIIGLILWLCYHIVYMKSWRLPYNAFNKTNNSIIITNNKIVPTYKIITAIRRVEIPDKAIFLIKTDDIKKNILKLDPIDDVYVRRFWFPARIIIVVREKIPVMLIAPDEKTQPIGYFTQDGRLIGHEYMPLKGNYKTFKILSYGNNVDDYKTWDLQKQTLIKKLAKVIEYYSSEPIEYIDMRNKDEVYVKIKTVLLRIGALNEANFEDITLRLSRLPSLLPQVKLLDKNIKYLDLRWKTVYYIKLSDDTTTKGNN